jgi:hypothetical protein
MGTTVGGDLTIDTIYLFPSLSPATYETATGKAAPAYDPTWGQQLWYDPNALTNADMFGNVTYTVLATNAAGTLLQTTADLPYTMTMTIPATRASVPNFYTGSTTPTKAEVPFPLNMAAMPSGFVFAWSQVMPGIPVLHNTAPPLPTASIDFTEADHMAIMQMVSDTAAIRTKVGA